MPSTPELLTSLAGCMVAAGLGMFLAVKRKGLERKKIENLAVGIVLGFASFLFVLLLNMAGINWSIWEEIIVGLVYTYYMADAAMFNPGGRSTDSSHHTRE